MSIINHDSAFVGRELRAINQAFAVATYAPDARLITANPQFVRLIGQDLSEIIDQPISALNPVDAKQLSELWERIGAGERVEKTGLWIARDGREVWLESRFIPITDELGELDSVVQIATDVTDREHRIAEERAQIFAIHRSQAVVHFSLEGILLSANDRFLDAMGYEMAEVLGRHHALFMASEERDTAAYAEFWQALGRGEHKSGEFRRIAKDGSEIWLQATYSPILDAAGRPIKVVKYATDITVEKVRQADYKWQVDAIHKSNCVITFDMFGTILDANDLFLEETGYTIEEIRGRHHRMFVETCQVHSPEYKTFWNDLKNGRPRGGQYKRYAKGGREIWLQATYNPIFDAGGRPVRVVKYASVVTEQRMYQAEHQGQIAAIDRSQCVVAFDTDGTILDANENFLNTMGYRFNEVRGRHHHMFVPAEEAQSEEYRLFWQGLTSGHSSSGEFKRLAKDGSEIWLRAIYSPIHDMEGRTFKIMKYAVDVTSEKLRHADHQGQIEAIHKSQDVAVFNLDGTILEMNDRFLEVLGYSRADLIGQHHSLLVERQTAESAEYEAFWENLRAGQYHSGLYKRLGKDGKEIWIQASYNPILDLNGQPVKVVKFATDVSSNVAMAEAFDEARRQAQHDSATSLPNRTKLASFMNACLTDPNAEMAVLYVDLDRFKPINDTFGHHVGDRVLGEVADRMRRVLRDNQLVARVGGDEFVIAAPGMTIESIERLCKKLYEQVTAPIRHDDGDISVGMSIGIALAPSDGTTPDELIRAADAALYRSKQNGRGIFSYYSSDLNAKINNQRQLIDDMRNSLTNGDFYLEYQPRFNTGGTEIRSVEALVRWAHPERGRISPQDFIPLAEQSGLIVPLGEWVLRTACMAATQWRGIGVSVNMSPIQFRDANIVQKVHKVLEETGLPGALLEIEITEGVLLDDAERAIAVLQGLKALGIKLAMDDFGTGYSSLSYLRNFPFDVIKIDRSFIADLDARESARPIVQAILGLGKALGLSVTAEGVETDAQLALLEADECNEVQGFLMGRPASAEDVTRLLASRNSGAAAE